MHRSAILGLAFVSALVGAADANAQGPLFERHAARVNRGAVLSLPSTASTRAILVRYLKDQGRDDATAESLVTVSESTAHGVRHVRFEQRVAGLRVFGTYAKASVNGRGELVNVIENLATVRGTLRAAQLSEAAAIRAAIRHLYPTLSDAPAGFFHGEPRATRVAVPNADGSMSAGFLVETWTEDTNQLHYTLVSGTGTIADVELRTNSDSYNVFRVYPGAAVAPNQEVVAGPGTGNLQSPEGWLAGGPTTRNIAGNNVRAYLDAVSDNVPDAEGFAVTDGNFLAAADLSQQPSISQNRDVAVQNLFYLNNVIHDELYRHGFTEGTGNFQENNFGNGGLGSDSVNAEAQDGGGTDNANFATPADGSNPRMQMYLWNGVGTHRVSVTAPAEASASYVAQGAEWGASLTPAGLSGPFALVNDGSGVTSDACQRLPRNSLAGRIAVADRGSCDFTVKASNVQTAGAVAIVVVNNVEGNPFTMGGTSGKVNIPGVMISLADGMALKGTVGASATSGTVALADPAPISRDGDVDSDIVWHEYGHGLTWRMIGNMSGPMSGAIGEGMSDVLALLMNSNDVVGEYSASDPAGIRSEPYTHYSRTYGDVTGSGVHFDGEVYAAIGWRLWHNFQGAGLSRDLLLDYLVDAMNFTPAGPDFEAMRDGILASVTDVTHECLVWDAFADFGVGVGADGIVRANGVSVTESFTAPATCARVENPLP